MVSINKGQEQSDVFELSTKVGQDIASLDNKAVGYVPFVDKIIVNKIQINKMAGSFYGGAWSKSPSSKGNEKPKKPAAAQHNNSIIIQGSYKTIKEEVFEAKLPVLVFFYAKHLSQSYRMLAIMEKVAQKHQGKFKFINVDLSTDLPAIKICDPKVGDNFKLPAIMLFNKGKTLGKQEGALDEATLNAILTNIHQKIQEGKI